MKTHFLIVALLMFFVGLVPNIAIGDPSYTLATFADPSNDSDNPLFSVDFLSGFLTGGWDDTKTGLTLEIPYYGHTFSDVWFDMTPVSIGLSGSTGSGVIRFFQDGTSTDPLMQIVFDNGSVSRFGYGSEEYTFVADIITISGSEIANELENEQFAFSFVNKQRLPGDAGLAGGFSATASFTSSAVVGPLVPEPTTIALLGAGVFSLIRRKKIA